MLGDWCWYPWLWWGRGPTRREVESTAAAGERKEDQDSESLQVSNVADSGWARLAGGLGGPLDVRCLCTSI